MNKLQTPFNTSGVAQAAALAALDDREHVDAVHRDECNRAEEIERGIDEAGIAAGDERNEFYVYAEWGRKRRRFATSCCTWE